MDTRIVTRPARPEDQAALLDIVWQTVLAEPEAYADVIASPDAVEVPIEQLDAATGCVAEVDGTIAGFAIVIPRADGEAELDALFVAPGLQRGGIGRTLIEAAKDLALAFGARRVNVVAGEKATAFYRAVGFVGVGTTRTRFGSAPVLQLTIDD